MTTLDKWRAFLELPKTLVFPNLRLDGRDHEPPIVIGSGEVKINPSSLSTYTLRGKPENESYSFLQVIRQRQNPYDALARFRLVGTDEAGVEWTFGYTVPNVYEDDEFWTFSGVCEGASTDDFGPTVCPFKSTELIFVIPTDHPVSAALDRFVRTELPEGKFVREYQLKTLGTTIRFTYDLVAGELVVTSNFSEELPLTYTENWLGEPLRVLFGQLIFPRLKARNFGDGRALIWITRTPPFTNRAGWAALWESERGSKDKEAFWSRYEQLLNLIARSRGFESHTITQLYHEIIQVADATRWVWAMTFASSIEALLKMIAPKHQAVSKADKDVIAPLVTHISSWKGDERLKSVAIGALNRTAQMTTIRALRDLKAALVITDEQVDAWEQIRNSVMHGSLLQPYSDEEEDARLLALARLFHSLTREVLRRSGIAPFCHKLTTLALKWQGAKTRSNTRNGTP